MYKQYNYNEDTISSNEQKGTSDKIVLEKNL